MASPAQAARVIELAIAAAWGLSTPVAWPNVAFAPPEAPWLKVDFIWGQGFITTKDGLNTVQGIVQLAVYSPKDEGDGPGQALAESARAIFNRVRLGDVMFSAPSGPVATFEESWRTLTVSVPFRVEETVP